MSKAPARRTIACIDGVWHEGNPPVLGPAHQAMWLSSVVFDGARAFEGVVPDLDRHCERLIRSARVMGLAPPLSAGEVETLAREGMARFAADAQLYICPMLYAEGGFVVPDPETTRFVLMIAESPLPEPVGFTACRSSFRRPARDMAPTEAKASCLYPNTARVIREAQARGCDTAVVMDPAGNVAEFGYTNLFLGKDGAVHTPAINGTFLNGVTRQRVIALLRGAGHEVVERAITWEEVLAADEVFATGNYAKVQPCVRIEDTTFEVGPLYRDARRLYWNFAHGRT